MTGSLEDTIAEMEDAAFVLAETRHSNDLLRWIEIVRACDTELAAARAVTRRFIEGWYRLPGAEGTWWREPLDGRGSPQHEPVTDAERAWLASVSPPASGEEQ